MIPGEMIPGFFLLGAAFLAGSLPTAFIAGKLAGVDIRRHGSGNVGATNAFRVLGKGPGILVFTIDFLKGFLPVLFFSNEMSFAFDMPLGGAALFVGLAAMLGHIFTPFLGFKGGKGVATGAGVLAGAYPVYFGIAVLGWFLCFFTTRIVSISSIAALAILVAASAVCREHWTIVLFFSAIFLLVVWTHRANIARLRKGEEKRIG